jgi:hypothetical protein
MSLQNPSFDNAMILFARPLSRTPLGIHLLAATITESLAAFEADEGVPAIPDTSSTSHRDLWLFGGWDLGFGTHGVL